MPLRKKRRDGASTNPTLSDLLGLKQGDGMVGGNQTKGGLRFGPKTSSTPHRPFGAGYGGGGNLNSAPGYLGPKTGKSGTKKGR